MNKVYNTMLAKTYVPDWGLWEGVREFYANCLDADPNFRMTFLGDDEVEFRTHTTPTLAHMLVMGHGTKGDTTDTIGQFGEGAKVGALCLARRKNTVLEIWTTDGKMEPFIRTASGFDVQTLHVRLVRDEALPSGCVVRIKANGLRSLLNDRILPGELASRIGPIRKIKNTRGMRLYVRGIFITHWSREDSLYDWNLDRVRLNRDRNVPDHWSVRTAIARFIDAAIQTDETKADEILRNPNSFEAQALKTVYMSDGGKAALVHAFERRYGANAVIAASVAADNQAATARGYQFVAIPEAIAEHLKGGGVKTATDVVPKTDHLVQVENAEEVYGATLAKLRRVMDIIGVQAELLVFEDDRRFDGRAEMSTGCLRVWLNRKFFDNNDAHGLMSTLCHELAHIKDRASDATLEFERSLDWIAGKLALHIAREF